MEPPKHARFRNQGTVLEVFVSDDVFEDVGRWIDSCPEVSISTRRLTVSRRQCYWDHPVTPARRHPHPLISLHDIVRLLCKLPYVETLNIFEVEWCVSFDDDPPLTELLGSFTSIKTVRVDGVYFRDEFDDEPKHRDATALAVLLGRCPRLRTLCVGRCIWASWDDPYRRQVGEEWRPPCGAFKLENRLSTLVVSFRRMPDDWSSRDMDMYTTLDELPRRRRVTELGLVGLTNTAHRWARDLCCMEAATVKTITLRFLEDAHTDDLSEWWQFSLDGCRRLRTVSIIIPLSPTFVRDPYVPPFVEEEPLPGPPGPSAWETLQTTVVFDIVRATPLNVEECRIRPKIEGDRVEVFANALQWVDWGAIAAWVARERPNLRIVVIVQEPAQHILRDDMRCLDTVGRLLFETPIPHVHRQ